MRIAAVEQRNFLSRGAVPHQLLDLIDKPLRLSEIAGRFVHPHRFARAGFGAQVFAEALAVVANQRVGGIKNIAEAAVVALKLDLVCHVELAHKISHVADARTTEGVDALVVVTHSNHRAAWHGACTLRRIGALPGQHLDPRVLQLVGVLKLVDQNMPKTPLVVFAYRRVVAKQLVAAQHQLAEIDHAFALALLFVQRINLYFFATFFVAHRHVFGALAVFLAAGDEIHQLLGRKAFVVNIELFAQALDRRQLILRVENLETLRQIGELVVRAQKAVAQAMKGANPHAAYVHRQHGGQPHQHFLGGLVGEGDRQNAAGGHLAGLQQPGDAGGEHPGFARTSTGQNQRMGGRQRHRRQLLWIKIL